LPKGRGKGNTAVRFFAMDRGPEGRENDSENGKEKKMKKNFHKNITLWGGNSRQGGRNVR